MVSAMKLFVFIPVVDRLWEKRPSLQALYGFADPVWDNVTIISDRQLITDSYPVAWFSRQGIIDGAITLFPEFGKPRALNARVDPPQPVEIHLFGDDDLFERNMEIIREERG